MSPPPDDGRDPDERPTLRPDEATGADEGGALSPEELDIEGEDNVVSLEEDRYVIGTDERPSVPDDAGERAGSGASGEASADGASDASADSSAEQAAADSTRGAAADAAGGAAAAGETSSGTVKAWLEDDLRGASARYGFHVTAKSEDAISHQQMVSDDVGTVFDSLLRWYAQQLTTETAVEDVLGILLTESNVRVRYSPSCLQAILEAYDLGPDDTIADLLEAVEDDRGMVFPPENV